jgi:hypothetical protein
MLYAFMTLDPSLLNCGATGLYGGVLIVAWLNCDSFFTQSPASAVRVYLYPGAQPPGVASIHAGIITH